MPPIVSVPALARPAETVPVSVPLSPKPSELGDGAPSDGLGEEAAPSGTAPDECPVCGKDACTGGVKAKRMSAEVCRRLGVPPSLPGGAEAMTLEAGGDCSWCGDVQGWTLCYSDTLLPVCVPCAGKLLPPDPFRDLDS